MTNHDLNNLKEAKTIACWCCAGTVEIKYIEYGPTKSYLYCVSISHLGTCKNHKLLIKTDGMRRGPYVILYGRKLYLEDATKVCDQ